MKTENNIEFIHDNFEDLKESLRLGLLENYLEKQKEEK